MSVVKIGPLQIGVDHPVALIAEIGLNHNGSVALAHKLIDAAAESGATLVKFQKREPTTLATSRRASHPRAASSTRSASTAS